MILHSEIDILQKIISKASNQMKFRQMISLFQQWELLENVQLFQKVFEEE